MEFCNFSVLMFHVLFTCLSNLFIVTFEPDIYIIACFSLKILLKTEAALHWPCRLLPCLTSPSPPTRGPAWREKGMGLGGSPAGHLPKQPVGPCTVERLQLPGEPSPGEGVRRRHLQGMDTLPVSGHRVQWHHPSLQRAHN